MCPLLEKKSLLIVFVVVEQSGWFVVRHEAEEGIVSLLHCGERLGFEKSHLGAEFEGIPTPNACGCQKILIRLLYPNRPLPLFLYL